MNIVIINDDEDSDYPWKKNAYMNHAHIKALRMI